jgi:hypothetical protein
LGVGKLYVLQNIKCKTVGVALSRMDSLEMSELITLVVAALTAMPVISGLLALCSL